MYCKYCGASVSDDSVFCTVCGKRICNETDSIPTVRSYEDNEEEIESVEPEEIFISDICIWCLAIIPVLVLIITEKLGIVDPNSLIAWVIPIGLNTIFLSLDEYALKESGMADLEWFILGFFLVPVYLVVREVKTNHNFVPAIIWTFLVLVVLFIL